MQEAQRPSGANSTRSCNCPIRGALLASAMTMPIQHMQRIMMASAHDEPRLPGWPDFTDWSSDIIRPCFMLLFTALVCLAPFLTYLIGSKVNGATTDPSGYAAAPSSPRGGFQSSGLPVMLRSVSRIRRCSSLSHAINSAAVHACLTCSR